MRAFEDCEYTKAEAIQTGQSFQGVHHNFVKKMDPDHGQVTVAYSRIPNMPYTAADNFLEAIREAAAD